MPHTEPMSPPAAAALRAKADAAAIASKAGARKVKIAASDSVAAPYPATTARKSASPSRQASSASARQRQPRIIMGPNGVPYMLVPKGQAAPYGLGQPLPVRALAQLAAAHRFTRFVHVAHFRNRIVLRQVVYNSTRSMPPRLAAST